MSQLIPIMQAERKNCMREVERLSPKSNPNRRFQFPHTLASTSSRTVARKKPLCAYCPVEGLRSWSDSSDLQGETKGKRPRVINPWAHPVNQEITGPPAWQKGILMLQCYCDRLCPWEGYLWSPGSLFSSKKHVTPNTCLDLNKELKSKKH